MSITRCNNPNWRNDAGIEPDERCVCGHTDDEHVPVGNRGCHATLHQPTEYHPGPCEVPGCHCSLFTAETPPASDSKPRGEA